MRSPALRLLALLAALFLLAGCAISSEDARLIRTAAAVADADLAEWSKLTDEQRKRALWRSARAWHRLDYSLCDEPLKPEWDVPATAGAETPR